MPKHTKRLFQYHQKVSPFDILILTRQLSTMISAGMPLIHALDSISLGHQKPSMKILLLALRTTIAEGCPFAESLSRHPQFFEPIFCQLISAAENSGTLEIMLKRIADTLEKNAVLKKKIKQALIYPLTIIGLTLIVSLFLMVFIVPEFQDLFASFGTTLPPFTCLIIQLSNFIQHQGWLMLVLSIPAVYTIKITFPDKHLLRLIIFGPLIKKALIARSSRTLATLLDAGTPLIDALAAVANTAGNTLYQNAFHHIRQNVTSGQSVYTAMTIINDSALFAPLLTQMIRVGEETGSLTAMLEKIADYYEEEVDQIVNNLSQLMEPLIMLILGTVVGCFVVAMYLPIFKLGSVV